MQNVVTTDQLLNKLKARIATKLDEQPYQNDDGTWIDPLNARDMAVMGGFILKMLEWEQKQEMKNAVNVNVVPIPALPPI